MHRVARALSIALLLATAAGCGGGPAPGPEPGAVLPAPLPQGGAPVRLDPAQFSTRIDNPWWPMRPGSRWVFRVLDQRGGQRRLEVTVTGETRTVMGIRARVVRELLTEGGQVVEEARDWYAQDAQGNIWDLGGDARELEQGKVTSTAGSWEAGVNGAQPGILIPAAPRPGLAYRQEHHGGETVATARVLSLGKRVKGPAGLFERVLVTEDFSPLDPAVLEHKFYARGVGPVLALTVKGDSGREELLRYQP